MPKGTCSIDGCESPARYSDGWCSKHHMRWRSTGDPLGLRPRRPGVPAAVRFVQRIKIDPATGCWVWQLKPSANGYAQFDNEGKTESVHRFAYRLFKGPIPEGLTIDHDCHNNDPTCAGDRSCVHRRCCNPCHLIARGTAENTLRGKALTAVNARKTHCPKGHPYDGDNLSILKRGNRTKRACRECMRQRSRAFYWRQREKAGTDRPQ